MDRSSFGSWSTYLTSAHWNGKSHDESLIDLYDFSWFPMCLGSNADQRLPPEAGCSIESDIGGPIIAASPPAAPVRDPQKVEETGGKI